jgi:hypothetical protein
MLLFIIIALSYFSESVGLSCRSLRKLPVVAFAQLKSVCVHLDACVFIYVLQTNVPLSSFLNALHSAIKLEHRDRHYLTHNTPTSNANCECHISTGRAKTTTTK